MAPETDEYNGLTSQPRDRRDSSIQYHSPESGSDGEQRAQKHQEKVWPDPADLPEVDQIIINVLDLVSSGDHEQL